jgi:hypothetical protein
MKITKDTMTITTPTTPMTLTTNYQNPLAMDQHVSEMPKMADLSVFAVPLCFKILENTEA